MGDYNPPPDIVRLISSLTERLSALERTRTIPVSAGPPTNAAPDGAMVVDITNHRLYVRDSGTWRFAATT
jgi:Flp pilus assembly CpaE family ATPase